VVVMIAVAGVDACRIDPERAAEGMLPTRSQKFVKFAPCWRDR